MNAKFLSRMDPPTGRFASKGVNEQPRALSWYPEHPGCSIDRPKLLIEATEQRPHLHRRVPSSILVAP
jgi:hypothetical protein